MRHSNCMRKATKYNHMQCISPAGYSKLHRQVWILPHKNKRNIHETGTPCEHDINFSDVKRSEVIMHSVRTHCKQALAESLLNLTNAFFIELCSDQLRWMTFWICILQTMWRSFNDAAISLGSQYNRPKIARYIQRKWSTQNLYDLNFYQAEWKSIQKGNP